MADRFRRIVKGLTGADGRELVGLLEAQADATLAGARLTRRVVGGDVALGDAREQMADIEHDGDARRGELVEALATVLTPPMDREDLYRLSRSTDDVLDGLRDLMRELWLLDIEREDLLADALDGVVDGVTSLRRAVATIVDRPGEARARALEAKKNGVRPTTQRAVARLLAGEVPVDAALLRRRELLARLDEVGQRLDDAADALADGAIKRSH